MQEDGPRGRLFLLGKGDLWVDSGMLGWLTLPSVVALDSDVHRI